VSYVVLLVALLIEVAGTSALKCSRGCSRPWLVCAAYAMYGVSIYMFGVALRTLSLAVADTIWQGLGIVLVCLVSAIAFGERLTSAQLAFAAVTVVGVVGLGLSS
jgi:multidrug transporter EmrE-like cation transporter